MRASYVLIITAFWCKVLILVSSCLSQTSAADKVKFSLGDIVTIRFDMSNMGEATAYTIFERYEKDDNLYTHSTREIWTPHIMVEYKQEYPQDKEIYIHLYKGEFNCNKKKVAELVETYKYRETAPINSCLTPEGCRIPVDWKNKCMPEPPRVIPADSSRKDPHEFHETLSIYENVDKRNQNINLTYYEGDNVTITCDTKGLGRLGGFTTKCFKWIQEKDNENIMELTTIDESFSTINLVITRLDHGTTIQCILYDPNNVSGRDNKKYSSDNIFVVVEYEKNKNVFETTTAVSKDVVSYHDFKELRCPGTYFKRSWMKLSKDGFLEKKLWKESYLDNNTMSFTLQLSLTEKDNNTNYMCLGQSIVTGKQHYHRREVSRIVHLVFNATEYHQVSHLLEIAGGAGGGAFCLLLIIIVCIICSRKQKRQRLTPLDVDTYSCPATVQYVDLQLQTMSSNTRRCLKKDDTPYALIVGVLEPDSR